MTDNKKENGSEHASQAEVTIIVDDNKYAVRPGIWIVRDLKATVGVDSGKVLAEITPKGLNDLSDNDKIAVRAHQRFMSHVRSGAAS